MQVGILDFEQSGGGGVPAGFLGEAFEVALLAFVASW